MGNLATEHARDTFPLEQVSVKTLIDIRNTSAEMIEARRKLVTDLLPTEKSISLSRDVLVDRLHSILDTQAGNCIPTIVEKMKEYAATLSSNRQFTASHIYVYRGTTDCIGGTDQGVTYPFIKTLWEFKGESNFKYDVIPHYDPAKYDFIGPMLRKIAEQAVAGFISVENKKLSQLTIDELRNCKPLDLHNFGNQILESTLKGLQIPDSREWTPKLRTKGGETDSIACVLHVPFIANKLSKVFNNELPIQVELGEENKTVVINPYGNRTENRYYLSAKIVYTLPT